MDFLSSADAGARRARPCAWRSAGAKPQISILASDAYVPWAGHIARHATADILGVDQGAAKTSLVFVNTRSQCASAPSRNCGCQRGQSRDRAVHHGSLAPAQRRKVESAMTRGTLRAVVCTSTLDLGIDWGAVDKVICIGAPKGAARLVQRIGRANHRLDEPSPGDAGAVDPIRGRWNAKPRAMR